MVHTDLKFFTNEPERDLYSRFAAILKSNTQFFDVLVGYFRASGFFKMYEALEQVEKIRILVGLNVDRYTVKIIDRVNDEAQYATISTADGKEMIADEIEKEFETAASSAQVEKGVRVFMDWLKSGKLEMRMYTEAPIHAKVYIMRKDQEKVPDTFGSVITGSSNFSEAGLVNNLEFNVELKDYADVKFALDKFEELWAQGTDIRDTYIEAVEQHTWMRDDITPYQLYLKTLYEFFKEEINADKENFETLLPEGYMRLQYQIDAVTQARQKLDAYNGVFISDVVGLGKTYICAMLANSFNRNAYKLIVCPPVLVDYWRSVLQEFDVARCDVESLGKLDKIIARGTDKYSYVFVDEAHRFRNSGTEAFTELHQICRDKKVILISATPINNYTSDVENQIYLFQAKQSGTINGIKNIEGFFRGLNAKLAKKPKGSAAYMEQLRENSEIIRDKLIREVMIRRTRSEIQQYYADDLAKQGLSFPKAGSPEKIIYSFDEETDDAFSQTINIIKDFKYARYTPLLYLKDKKKYATMLAAQRNMGGFMKGILVKRLESSFYAFRKTLERFIESYEKFIEMSKTGKIYISKKVNVYDLLDDGNTQKLMYLIEQQDVMEFETKEFSSQFFRDLQADLAQLKSMQFIWSLIGNDPKLNEFKRNLTTNPLMKGKKAIVFTESTETAQYLYTVKEKRQGNGGMYISENLFKLDADGKVVVDRLKDVDEALKNVRVADPAVGSGAFPLGMLNEIVRARQNISAYMAITMNAYDTRLMYQMERSPHNLKYETIKNCIFAADIEPSAVDIAQLRLWLSLVIDDEINPNAQSALDGHKNPLPLPNLESNILCGNSLIDEFEGTRLIKESELFGDSTYQLDMNHSRFESIVSALIDKQNELFHCEDTEKKKQLKDEIESLRDMVIISQLEGCTQDKIQRYHESKRMASKPYVLWQLDFARVFREKGGFDIVIGNPPYVDSEEMKRSMPEQREIYTKKYSCAKGNWDLFVLFIEKGMDLLAKNKTICNRKISSSNLLARTGLSI